MAAPFLSDPAAGWWMSGGGRDLVEALAQLVIPPPWGGQIGKLKRRFDRGHVVLVDDRSRAEHIFVEPAPKRNAS
jgi:hypothetical protein